MLTQNEITSLSLSPTKKDFVQIWNELLDVASRLSERWDPTSTNESDPGIVILKALAGIADKLNYNIDKNTLEAFMPTAAQEDSMRKLCDMLGYNVKYYQSAKTSVYVKHHNTEPSEEEVAALDASLAIPKFTVISNADQDINYFTINESPVYIQTSTPSVEVDVMEGQIVKCESINDNSVITANQLTDDRRFYFPETQIAENGVFVYNVFNSKVITGQDSLEDGYKWTQVDNLNVQQPGSRVYKFCFDSYEGRPYLAFPEDAGELFEDGLFIYYTRTSGAAGNVSTRTLTKLEFPSSEGWSNVSAESISVENVFAATNGANIETIKQAYNNFKKTIGTFETLVTCRDYMNKIYTMTNSLDRPIVSNVLVTDIRNDLNRAVTICSCDRAGIFYRETPILEGYNQISTSTSYDKTETYYDEPVVSLIEGTYVEDGEPEVTPPTEFIHDKEQDFFGAREFVSDNSDTAEWSEYTLNAADSSKTTSEPKVIDTDTVTTSVDSVANKPCFSSSRSVTTTNAAGETTDLHWFVGHENGAPMHPADYIIASSSSVAGSYTNFDYDATGEVVADTITFGALKGKRSWAIKQGDTTFKTNLLIETITSTATTVTQERTTTVKERYEREKVVEQEYVRTKFEKHIGTETVTKFQRKTDLKNTVTTKNVTIYDSVQLAEVEPKYAIDRFSLVIYPFKSYTQIKSNVKDIRSAYDTSFDLAGPRTFSEISNRLEASNIQTVAHSLESARAGSGAMIGDLVSINNYLRLSATITTTSKITVEEGSIIIDKIKIALANAFNMRELDFGEEIPFDSIVEVMEAADSRIRLVSLNEPHLYTTFSIFDSYVNNNPVIKEYAVESSQWLTTAQAVAADRFDMDKYKTSTVNGVTKTESLSTFNTAEARRKYNELVVRNVLAGRVPLFNYNETFSTGFTEGAYQVTTELEELPTDVTLPKPHKDAPLSVCANGNNVYSAAYTGSPEAGNEKIIYSVTGTPAEYDKNIISDINGKAITGIETECKVFAEAGKVNNLELASGEFIKFRAPNFTTVKTYPAYVNYHLELNKDRVSEAMNATAFSLFEVLDKDRTDWTLENPVNGWQRAINYFYDIDRAEGKPEDSKDCYLQVAKQKQTISAYAGADAVEGDTCQSAPSGTHENDGTGKCKYCGASLKTSVQKGPVIVEINDGNSSEEAKDLNMFLNNCGGIKFSRKHEITFDASDRKFLIKPILAWVPDVNGAVPDTKGPDLDLSIKLSSPFITSTSVLDSIALNVQTRLEEMLGQVKADGSTPMLPTAGDWTITFEYEGAPFEPKSLEKWKGFIDNEKAFIGFEPYSENGITFWRLYEEGYPDGKYILQSSEKLLKFDRNYFSLLPTARTRGIYLIQNVGSDGEATTILNDEEYRLRANEYLYIEYTPTTTTEDGSTKEGDPVREVLGEGTIIRPSGFEVGLFDSSEAGVSFHKTVDFETETGSVKPVQMLSFGANEQVEVRDFAKVELSKTKFKSSPTIYYYKNFNDCDALEDPKAPSKRYTLKEGEYIFYTDQNQSELAYFTTGTEVRIEGNFALEQFEVVELSTIFDSGMTAIPWSRLKFNEKTDKLIFQEFQYVTLGAGDTIKTLTLLGSEDGTASTDELTDNWQFCDGVEYLLAGAEEPTKLSTINTYDDTTPAGRRRINRGCGWEVSSALELDVTADSEQTLRITDQIATSLKLTAASASGDVEDECTIVPLTKQHPLSFKTNLNCQTGSKHISISDITVNPDKLAGFEFKLFSKEGPAYVETVPGKVLPYDRTVTDLTKWEGDAINLGDSTSLWQEIALKDISVQDLTAEKPVAYDRALRLPVTVLPDTYGVFTIYLDYTAADRAQSVWIETLPGTAADSVTLINVTEAEIERTESVDDKPAKLFLRPGVNCLRTNYSGRLFIKASANAQGALYFDNLKLVNSKSLNCTITTVTEGEEDKPVVQHIDVRTDGLNIEQLGYLLADENTTLADTLAVDNDLKEKLIKDSVDTANEKLSALEKSATKTFNSNRTVVEAELLPRLEALFGVVNDAKTELETIVTRAQLSENGGSVTIGDTAAMAAYAKILEQYAALHSEITKEESLLNAIKENKSTQLLEGKLAEILARFETREATAKKLMEELAALKANALTELDELSHEEVLADFDKSMKDGDNYASIDPAALEQSSKDFIELDYNTKLIPLINSMDSIVNSEDRMRLFTLLGSLKEQDAAAARADVLVGVKRLIDTVDKSELEGLLDAALSNALHVNYIELDATLQKLYTFLSNNDFDALIVELEAAAADNNDAQTVKILNLLKTAIDGKAANDSTLSTLSGLIASVSAKHNADKEDTNITTSVKDLCTTLNTEYKNRLTNMIDGITGLLAATATAAATYQSTLEALKASQDNQVKTILQSIEYLGVLRSTRMLTVTLKDGTNTFRTGLATLKTNGDMSVKNIATILPFGEEAIQKVWRTHLIDTLTAAIDEVSEDLATNIVSLTSTTAVSTSTISSVLVESSAAFHALALKVVDAATKHNQYDSYKDILVSTQNVDSKELADALNAWSVSSPADYIETCIKEYKDANTPAKKQQAITALKSALENHLGVLKDVANALCELVCPSILTINNSLPEAYDEGDYSSFLLRWIAAIDQEYQEVLATAVEKAASETKTDVASALLKAYNLTNKLLTDYAAVETLLNAMQDKDVEKLKEWFVADPLITLEVDGEEVACKLLMRTTLETIDLPDAIIDSLVEMRDSVAYRTLVAKALAEDFVTMAKEPTGATDIAKWFTDNSADNLLLLDPIVEELTSIIAMLNSKAVVIRRESDKDTEAVDTYETYLKERDLLSEIRRLDSSRLFYYTSPCDHSIAIELNNSEPSLNTLMNPATLYDVNNINNCFVISKLDIDFLDKGLQIARSSRLS